MKKIVLGFSVALLCVAFLATEAEARRLGGGSIGAQRSITSAPASRPAQAQPAPQSPSAAAPAALQPAASGLSRWMPMLGGLALGGALGWLLGANGMGGALVGMMLFALLAFAAVYVFRMLAPRRAEAPVRMQYAGLGSETVAAPPPSQSAGFEAQPPAAAASVPAGFDVAGFLRSAKLNYMKLQIANDRGDLAELREFTSDGLFEDLKKDVQQRGAAKQQTDVLALNADLLEVVTEGDKHWASVRFSGMLRESPGDAPTGFEEVWNLAKPVDGSQGWQLAGIQQMH
ncbi:MAG TPA: Tim44-like domain-containing protein [Burkholderiales bacterium]|nr:Tim44-like domain-containing protein [Burkholderiales bacterium]